MHKIPALFVAGIFSLGLLPSSLLAEVAPVLSSKSPGAVVESVASPPDLELESMIRRTLSNDPSLSKDARKIQVIADDGKVMLKGEVKNAEEKFKVESLVEKIAGSSSVNSALKVK
jgi:osmotically-inducible protein OsmY